MHAPLERGNSSKVAFPLWIAFALIALAVLSCALGLGPAYDPDQLLSIFAAP
jgi:hypothetical protein